MTERIKHLGVLELAENATLAEIRAAYRELVKVWHPDRFGNDAKLQARGHKKIQELNASYEWLVQNTTTPPPARERQFSAFDETSAKPKICANVDESYQKHTETIDGVMGWVSRLIDKNNRKICYFEFHTGLKIRAPAEMYDISRWSIPCPLDCSFERAAAQSLSFRTPQAKWLTSQIVPEWTSKYEGPNAERQIDHYFHFPDGSWGNEQKIWWMQWSGRWVSLNMKAFMHGLRR